MSAIRLKVHKAEGDYDLGASKFFSSSSASKEYLGLFLILDSDKLILLDIFILWLEFNKLYLVNFWTFIKDPNGNTKNN